MLHPVDPIRNAHRRRAALAETTPAASGKAVPFDPARALLDRASGRRPSNQEKR